MRRREITLPYRLQVRVELRNVTSLRQLAFTSPRVQARNVAYNAVCLFHKII